MVFNLLDKEYSPVVLAEEVHVVGKQLLFFTVAVDSPLVKENQEIWGTSIIAGLEFKTEQLY